MYAPTSMPFVSRTRATFRSAEFGFLGVTVYTRVHTPRFCGAPRSAGVFVFPFSGERGWRTSWLTVGMRPCLGEVFLAAHDDPPREIASGRIAAAGVPPAA